MRQQLKGFAAFLADSPQFTAQDVLTVQKLCDKALKMLVSRVQHGYSDSQSSLLCSHCQNSSLATTPR
ncbi:hypothetical protein ABBQ32_011828 [Trebouxia sp. C0010 RCD-2024]